MRELVAGYRLEELLNKRRVNEVEGNLLCNKHTEKESLKGFLRDERRRVRLTEVGQLGGAAPPALFVTRADIP